MERRAERPTVKDSEGHFALRMLRVSVAGCLLWMSIHVLMEMCVCTSLLITISSHHGDGGAGVRKALFSLSLVHSSGAAIVLGLYMIEHTCAQCPFIESKL